MRHKTLTCALIIFFCIGSDRASADDVILNEYNAVNGSDFLNGGTAAADEDGGRAQDSYFGRVQGNGGDWFELVVVTDHLDMRGWSLEIWLEGVHEETLDLTNHMLWSDLRSGTIVTVAEDAPDNVTYNPQAGDWWINVQANVFARGTYISNSGFPVTNDDWQLVIRDADGLIRGGPAGEGVSVDGGINSREIFRLEADPDESISPDSMYYNDGNCLSTFGSANQWGLTPVGFLHRQNFRPLRGCNPADFDEDGAVDIRDFCVLAESWATTEFTPGWNPDCDIAIPADNLINWMDVAAFCNNWLD